MVAPLPSDHHHPKLWPSSYYEALGYPLLFHMPFFLLSFSLFKATAPSFPHLIFFFFYISLPSLTSPPFIFSIQKLMYVLIVLKFFWFCPQLNSINDFSSWDSTFATFFLYVALHFFFFVFIKKWLNFNVRIALLFPLITNHLVLINYFS